MFLPVYVLSLSESYQGEKEAEGADESHGFARPRLLVSPMGAGRGKDKWAGGICTSLKTLLQTFAAFNVSWRSSDSKDVALMKDLVVCCFELSKKKKKGRERALFM